MQLLLTPRPRSIYLTLSVLMIGMVLLLYAALAAYQLRASQQRMLASAAETFERVGREAVAAIEGEMRPARTSAVLLAQTPLLTAASQAQRLQQLPLLASALQQNPSLSAVYGGTLNGSFVLLRRLAGAELRALLQAPAAAEFLLQSVDRDGAAAHGQHLFYDARLRLLERRERPDYDFDPRQRLWFVQAREPARGEAVLQTAPYLFFTTREVGLTLASAGSGGVAGVDLSLGSLSQLLARQRITPSAELMILDAQGAVLAYRRPERLAGQARSGDAARLARVEELGVPVLSALWQRSREGRMPPDSLLQVDEREWVLRIERLSNSAGPALTLAIAAPRDELQADAIRARRLSMLITAAIVLLMLPLVHWAANLVARPLEQLAREAEAIRRFDFAGPEPARSRIREVDRLALAMAGMKQTLRRFLDISSALAAERQFDTLLERILSETVSVAGASGGAIHLLSDDGLRLEPAAARVNGAAGERSALKPWRLDDAASPSATVQAVRQGRTVFVDIGWDKPEQLNAYGFLLKGLNSARFRLMALPLKNRRDEIIGSLTLSFAPDDEGQDGAAQTGLAPPRVAFIEALSGTAAVAIDNQLLLRERKELLESFIRMVAGAIDAKSPYTGGHCQRVPELSKMLARAACAADSGPFADFQLDAEQWEALHIAAWLHDCGKVTTPEFVVDKATKLETLHNRIHEIRTRFEVLKRDARIELGERLLSPAQREQLQQDLAPMHQLLDAEFAFVAGCNEGGEQLSADKLARLREIGARCWWRSLDDRLGVSRDELRRQAATPAATLPVQERLLADKPEHLLAREPQDSAGFRLRAPEHLYNRGELHNLSIERGTLTEEERYKINEHIVQSIRMLEALPFPRHLKRVPEIAGGHHEKMDGSGYPRGLRREQMSVEARMMAIADVFEALTADDRPYKKGKSLSEAMAIMARMRREQHIDAELFELFLRSGVYLDYARRFMNPAQIDAVDVEAALA